jgi:hypothetical protein
MSTQTKVSEKPILFKGEMIRAILENKKTQTRRVMKTQPLGYSQAPNCVFVAGDGSEKISEWFTVTPKEYAKAYTEKYYGDNWQKAKHYRSSLKFAQGNQYSSYHPNVLSIHEYAYGCPYGKIGDRLWVRETFAYVSPDENRRPVEECNIEYRADTNDKRPGGWDNDPDDPAALVWKPSIFMPRAASRITLEVTGVRVERLQDISEEDAIAEGAPVEDFYGEWLVPDPMPQKPSQWYRDLWDKINAKKCPWSSNPWVWVISFKRLEPALAESEGV